MDTNTAAQLQGLSPDQLLAKIAELEAKLAAGKKPSDRTSIGDGLTAKVSEKGAVSVYGVHSRFPITLYKSQWMRLFSAMAQLRAFIEANDSKLAVKAPKAVK